MSPPMRSGRIVAVLAVLFVGVLATWCALHVVVQTDITDFIPAGDDPAIASLSRELTSSDLNRTITLTLEGTELEQVTEATAFVAAQLSEREEVAWVRAGPDPELERAFYESYYEHRLGFAADLDVSEPALRARARALRERLASPTGTFVREIATADPLLLFLEQVQTLRSVGTSENDEDEGLGIRNGVFVAEEGESYFGVVILASVASPFDGVASRAILGAIDDAFAAAPHHESLVLEQGGVHRIAVDSESTIRADITRVSAFGSLGVVLIILLLFRSLRMLVLSSLPIFGGMVAAAATTQLVFGGIHGLTLAFGATLIGVALDYVVHLMNHHVLCPGETPQASLRVILPGLVLGAATTVAGLAGLAWTSFPGIRQMAVFTSVGVAVALVLTILVLPPFLPNPPKPTALHKRLATTAGGFFEGLARRQRIMGAFVLACVVIAAVGLPQLVWEDDIRALSPMNAELVAEDERVRARVARMDAGRLLFVTGATMEEALVRNDELYGRLVQARDAGELEAFRSLHAFLPSVATQSARVASLPDDLFARTMSAYVSEGFVAEAFAPFDESLRSTFEPLTFDAFESTPLALLTRSHRIDTGDGVILLTFVRGVRDSAQIQTRIDGIEGAHYFDQSEYMASAYRAFRGSTVELVGLGLFFVFFLVFIRYRALRPSLAAFLPATLAAATALGVFGVLGIPANLLHVVCLLLVLSMGVDYGVFMVEAGRDTSGPGGAHSHEAPTLVSLVVACASTFASFGVLALSHNPALRAMGLTAAIGVFVSLVLAPSAWLLLRPSK